MADVFISYSREDRARAEQVAGALTAMGLDVFWDSEIPPGKTWADYIEEKLTGCKAVVVLWSEHSTRSQWVREEARMGRDKGVLIPAMLDASAAPFGFGEVQAANLATWTGEGAHPEWSRFAEAVRAAASGARAPEVERRAATAAAAAPPRAPTPVQAAPTQAKKGAVPVWAWIVGSVVATVVVLGIIGSTMNGAEQQPTDTPPVIAETPSEPAPSNALLDAPSVAPAAPAPSVASGADPTQVILSQLGIAEQTLRQQGFQQVGQPVSGSLNQGLQWNWPVSLNAGWDYRILGVCDQDCADLDLTLFDQAGVLISQDTSTDDHPLLQSQPAWNGPFTIQVTMYNCSVPPCYYARWRCLPAPSADAS